MSADNGIYIWEFPDGFRVCHGQAIENLSFYPEGTPEWKNEWISYFWSSQIYKTVDEALKEARRLSDKFDTEYGIQVFPLVKTPIFEEWKHYIMDRNLLLSLGFKDINNHKETYVLSTDEFSVEAFFGLRDTVLEFSFYGNKSKEEISLNILCIEDLIQFLNTVKNSFDPLYSL